MAQQNIAKTDLAVIERVLGSDERARVEAARGTGSVSVSLLEHLVKELLAAADYMERVQSAPSSYVAEMMRGSVHKRRTECRGLLRKMQRKLVLAQRHASRNSGGGGPSTHLEECCALAYAYGNDVMLAAGETLAVSSVPSLTYYVHEDGTDLGQYLDSHPALRQGGDLRDAVFAAIKEILEDSGAGVNFTDGGSE